MFIVINYNDDDTHNIRMFRDLSEASETAQYLSKHSNFDVSVYECNDKPLLTFKTENERTY